MRSKKRVYQRNRISKRNRILKRNKKSNRKIRNKSSRKILRGGNNLANKIFSLRDEIFRDTDKLSEFVDMFNSKKIKLTGNINAEIHDVTKDYLNNSYKLMRRRNERNGQKHVLINIEEKEGKDYVKNFCFYEMYVIPMLNLESINDEKLEFNILKKLVNN
jgi:hypothetical protein